MASDKAEEDVGTAVSSSTNEEETVSTDDSSNKVEENGKPTPEIVSQSEPEGVDSGTREASVNDNKEKGNSKEGAEKPIEKEAEAEKVATSRPMAQPTKRRPEKELNHLNWDEEEEPEEKGEFVKASEDQLKERKILTARRKAKPAGEAKSNPFGGLSLAGNPFGGGATGTTNMFSFSNPQPVSVPKFDFGNVTSSKSEGKKDDTKSDDGPSKKLKMEEPQSRDPKVSASAATV